MKEIAEEIGIKNVYGDTDSLFVNYEDNETDLSQHAEESLSKFKEECRKQVGIEVEHATKYKTPKISDKKLTFFINRSSNYMAPLLYLH